MDQQQDSSSNAPVASQTPVQVQSLPIGVASAGPLASAGGPSSSSLQCQWVGCGERAASAEALYDHVCERHIGRKSTNNLNLTCAWGNCHTVTVKRDHITSHMRVHVPLKPHKCSFCGKSFKRPQDLKKHVKTHADDSVVMRSPADGQGGGRQQPNNGFNNMGNQGRPAGYYPDSSMHANAGMSYGYQGQNGGGSAYYPSNAQQAAPYAPVYYQAIPTGDTGGHSAYEGGRAGYAAMENLFSAIKNRTFDPMNYHAVNQQLMQFQGIQLPIPNTVGGGSALNGYHGGPIMGGQAGVYGPVAHYGQNLPSFTHLRTKSDLTELDAWLKQMTHATYDYEHSSQVPEAGLGQPGAVPVSSGLAMRHSNSPPAGQLPSSHHSMASQATNSPTPGLTPGSSTLSFTSGNSPTSVHSNHGMSPASSGPLYPMLPTTSAPMGMTPTSTLGAQYDYDSRRRHSGGYLQKARPGSSRLKNEVDMMKIDTEEEPGSPQDKPEGVKKPSKVPSNIDPALSGGTVADSSSSSGSVTPPAVDKGKEAWSDNVRLLESLKKWVEEKLERGDYQEDDGEGKDKDEEVKEEPQSLYPELKI